MKVSQLYIHPIKSTASAQVNSINYTLNGPEFDREWMVVDLDGAFLTQRVLPKMCLIRAIPAVNGIKLSAPAMPTITAQAINRINRVKIWNDTVNAVDCGDQASDWLSQYLGKSCRLVAISEQTKRLVDTDFAKHSETVGFADGFPTLLVSQESLDEFNVQFITNTESTIPALDMRRFRPNIVVSGGQAYAEDKWQSIKINNITFDLVKACSRCIIPSINPDTGTKNMQVNQTLLNTRRRGRQTYFGQNALHRGTGKIHVGDTVELIATR